MGREEGLGVGVGGCGKGLEGRYGRSGVDCRDHGEVVLVLKEVGGRRCNGGVQGVEEGRIVRAERELGHYVGEIEF